MTSSSKTQGISLDHALSIASSRSGRFVRRIVWRICSLFGRHYCKINGSGWENLNIPGPLIVAPVHRSILDAPLLVTLLTSKMLYYLAKESLFSPRPLGWFLASLGAIPISRGAGDREALKAAQTLLEKGESIVVFPEGTRQSGTRVGQVFDGAAFLAARTGAKIVPVGIAGTEQALPSGTKFPKRTNVCFVAGEPMELSNPNGGRVSAPQRKVFMETLASRLQNVFDQAQADLR